MFYPVYFRDDVFLDVPFQGKIFSSKLGRAYISFGVEVTSLRPENFLVLGFLALWWVSSNENSMETRNLHNTLYIT